MASKWFAAALFISVLTAGCGGEGATDDEASAPESTTPIQTEAASPEPEPSPTATGREVSFDYTDQEGWHYAGTFVLDEVTVRVTKDISASPPGKAMGYSEVSTTFSEPQFGTDNPGRPDGPALNVHGQLALPGPQGEAPEGTVGMCSASGDEPFPNTYACAWTAEAQANRAKQDEQRRRAADGISIAEAVVDARVAALDGRPVTYVLNFVDRYGDKDECNVFLLPEAAEFTFAKKYTDADCGKLELNVST